MYLSCGNRPDIAFAIRQLSRRNVDPRVGHLKAVKQIVWYLKSIMHLGIIYEINSSPSQKVSDPQSPANSNYAGNPEDWKLVMEYYFFINGIVVLWCSKKQQTISTSTIKTEYIALGHAAQKNMWIRHFFNKLEVAKPINVYILHRNNKISIILTKNAES